MMSARLIPLLAFAASAEYAITNVLGQQGAGPASPQIGGPTGAPVNPMAMLAGLAGAASNAGAANGPFSGGALSTESMSVVSGLVEAFMHKVRLEPGERSCLENNIREASGDIMGTVGDVVTTVKALIAGKGTVKKKAAGGLISAGVDAAMKLTSLVTSSMQLVKHCVHGDALKLMNTTAKHFIDGKYLEDRFIVNGVDIAHSLSDAVIAFDLKDYRRFGVDIGTALRKILLSNTQNATRLPEGMPEEEIIQQATDGLMRGFFARGSGIEITDKAHPDVDIVIDLHRCIAGNSVFFKELWLSAWHLFAQLSVNRHQHGLGIIADRKLSNGQQPKWEGELMVALMQFPTALANCGVSQGIQTMFMDAVKSLDKVHVEIKFPQEKFSAQSTADDMAKAVESWSTWNFRGFGYELGTLLRELLMLALPQKYSVDASGKLRRFSQSKIVAGQKNAFPSSTVIVGGAAMSAIAAFAIVRTRRVMSAAHPQFDALMSDAEISCSEECELGE